jgi:hypothetical protein
MSLIQASVVGLRVGGPAEVYFVPGGSMAQSGGESHSSPKISSPHGPPAHRALVAGWSTYRDGAGDEYSVGDLEEPSQIGLYRVVHARERPSISQRSGSQQEILTGGIDGASFHRVRCSIPDEAGQDQNGNLLEVINEVLHGLGHPGLGAVSIRTAARVIAIGPALAGPDPPGAGSDQPLCLSRLGPVNQHDEPEGLPV